MRTFTLITALLTLALAAPAGAAETFTCVLPAGSGGEAMEVTLSAEAGGCPGPGEAVPRKWIVGEPRVIGAVQAVQGASVTRPPAVARPAVVQAQPLDDPRAGARAAPAAPIPAAAVAAVQQARTLAAAPADDAAATPADTASATTHAAGGASDLAGFAAPGILLVLAAIALSGVLAVRRPQAARATA